MDIRVITDGSGSGTWNMAVDEALLTMAASSGRGTLRLYRWSEPTLSLGYFQPLADRDGHSASRSCPLVRRASGGGAILHDREWTYSLTLPDPRRGAAESLYDAVHQAIVRVLSGWGVTAQLCSSASPARPFLCFQRRATGDIVLGRHKIGGSAQRRFQGAILQHGSVLLERSPCAPELPGVSDLARCPADVFERFPAELVEELSRGGMGRLDPGWIGEDERALAERIKGEKFAQDAWTRKR